MADLLLELLSEEIPAALQSSGANELKQRVTTALVDAGLTYEGARAYATPRRLTLDLRGISAKSGTLYEERKGPSIHAPQTAIAGFLRSVGFDDISQAHIIHDPKKGDFYHAKIVHKGRNAQDIIAEIIPPILRQFSWPKSMRWGAASINKDSLSWIRPLSSILCLFITQTDTEIIPFQIGDIISGDTTSGHPFMGTNSPLKIRDFEDYVSKLEQEKVILDHGRRKAIILADAQNLCFAHGLSLVEDDALAEEIAGLTEWPVVLMGQFSKNFLQIPPEIIRLTIRNNQKCFVTCQRNNPEQLLPYFILTANILTKDMGKTIIAGNEKVVRARLSDALYFWQKDQAPLPNSHQLATAAEKFNLDLQKPLDQRMAKLEHLHVAFHQKLGSQGDRIARIAELASIIAQSISADPIKARRAAILAKADLQTEIVNEFPQLQGLMGRYYADLQGEDLEISQAMEDHYKPQSPNDSLPRNSIGLAVALADKIDMLVGFWLIAEKPTGSKDPYALRRAALGVIRLILGKELTLDLMPIFQQSSRLFNPDLFVHNKQNPEETLQDLLLFFHERLHVYLRHPDTSYDRVDAAILAQEDNLFRIDQRLKALISFMDTEQGKQFVAHTKRVTNFLDSERKKENKSENKSEAKIDPNLFIEQEEVALYDLINIINEQLIEIIECNPVDKQAALDSFHVLLPLGNSIDQFFDKILINDKNPSIRANRLALLTHLQRLYQKVADFSKLILSP